LLPHQHLVRLFDVRVPPYDGQLKSRQWIRAEHHGRVKHDQRDPAGFLADLAGQEPAIRGLGPTTTAAIERFRRGGEAAGSPARATNGAAMRALPIGWVLPHSQAERRRQLTITMSQATHADPAALVAACVIATCASWALEGASSSMLLTVAAEEAREAAQAVTTGPRLAEMLGLRTMGFIVRQDGELRLRAPLPVAAPPR
jgi:ADP-ribosylglycohydrolase